MCCVLAAYNLARPCNWHGHQIPNPNQGVTEDVVEIDVEGFEELAFVQWAHTGPERERERIAHESPCLEEKVVLAQDHMEGQRLPAMNRPKNA